MAGALGLANPSSVHAEGRQARKAVDVARRQVAELAGADPACVVFTSGATEALNLALRALEDGGPAPDRLLTTRVEHPAVLAGHRFPASSMMVLPVDGDGVLDLAALARAVAQAGEEGERVLLALQLANNETGVIQPVRAAADIVHGAGGLVLSDCVQAAGRLPLSMPALGADAIVLSAHKLGGPKGVGALVFASEGLRLGEATISGGGQEKGRRAGTENVGGIVGFGVAAEVSRAHLGRIDALRHLRDTLEEAMSAQAPEIVIFGRRAGRLANTSCFSLPGLRAETAVIGYDLDGVAVSSGAACSSGKVRRSDVLAAMGVPDPLAEGAVRVSFGWTNGEDDIERFLASFRRRLAAARARQEDEAA